MRLGQDRCLSSGGLKAAKILPCTEAMSPMIRPGAVLRLKGRDVLTMATHTGTPSTSTAKVTDSPVSSASDRRNGRDASTSLE